MEDTHNQYEGNKNKKKKEYEAVSMKEQYQNMESPVVAIEEDMVDEVDQIEQYQALSINDEADDVEIR